MTLSYETCKKLKEAGFAQELREEVHNCVYFNTDGVLNVAIAADATIPDGYIKKPNLSELIEACGNRFTLIGGYGDGWWAYDDEGIDCREIRTSGPTPEEAVSELYLALKSK